MGGSHRSLTFLLAAALLTAGWPLVVATDGPPSGQAPTWLEPALAEAIEEAPETSRTLILGLEAPAGPELIETLTQRGYPPMTFEHVPVAAVEAPGTAVEDLAELPEVISIAGDRELEWYGRPGPTMPLDHAEPGNLGDTGDRVLRADQARALGVDGTDVGVAVIDSGINTLHPEMTVRELGGPVVANAKVMVGREPQTTPLPAQVPANVVLPHHPNSDTTSGHGTHVAGTVAGHWTDDGTFGGRAPGADLVGVGAGATVVVLWAVAAFDWVLEHQDEHQIRVVTNSYGVAGPYQPQHPLTMATRAADEAGMLVLFAAGNDGPEQVTLNRYAQAPWVVAVGATTMSASIPEFSSRGDPTAQPEEDPLEGKRGPEVVAPGNLVVAPRSAPVTVADTWVRFPVFDSAFVPPEHLGFYRTEWGTSMATPQVAGVGALMFDANPALTPAEAREILNETARPILGAAYHEAGHGLVDAEAAVLQAQDAWTPEPGWATPTVVEQDGPAFTYPFHGATLGASLDYPTMRTELPFPVRLPAEGLDVSLQAQPLASPEVTGHEVDGFSFELIGADGEPVRTVQLTLGQEAPATHTFHVTADELEAHAEPGWSASHWTAIVDLDAGAMVWDVDATVTYDDASLPDVVHEPATSDPEPDPVELVPHDPILIESDDSFTEANGVVAGSGTADDPYVISGWDIRAGDQPAISIDSVAGTTAHVLIRDVYLHDAQNYCLYLGNAQNVVVEGSELVRCGSIAGVYLTGGTQGTKIQGITVRASDGGVSVNGAPDTTIRDSRFEAMGDYAVYARRGPPGGGTVVTGMVIEGNTMLGAGLDLTTESTYGAEVQGNTFGDGAGIEIGLPSAGHVFQASTWLDGQPRYSEGLILVEAPAGTSLSTIVDAGADVPTDAEGEACFEDVRILIQPPWQRVQVQWIFGDGQSTTGADSLCHIYPDPSASYQATLLVTIQQPTGETRVLTDTVQVG